MNLDFTGAALVLTGGSSTRMGWPKALLPYRGSDFLGLILQRLRELELPFVGVVTSPDLPLEAPGARVVVNPDPSRGQLSSLQAGLRAAGLDYPWLLVALVDYPAVSGSTYRTLAAAAQKGDADMWAPRHGGRRGHPVVFGAPCYEDLLSAPMEQGARWVVARHRERRLEVPVDDAEIHRDVDTPADYQELRAVRRLGPP